jgi:hypothetical protein
MGIDTEESLTSSNKYCKVKDRNSESTAKVGSRMKVKGTRGTHALAGIIRGTRKQQTLQ